MGSDEGVTVTVAVGKGVIDGIGVTLGEEQDANANTRERRILFVSEDFIPIKPMFILWP